MSIKLLLSEIADGWVAAKGERFTNHPIANQLRNELKEAVRNKISEEHSHYLIKSSAGAGNWADVPWLSILNPKITETTQSGIYPVYLFRADGTGIYLSLGFGTTKLKEKYGAVEARTKAAELQNKLRQQNSKLKQWNTDIDLRSGTTLGKSYELATAGAKFYPSNNIPDDKILVDDLHELINIYSNLDIEAPIVPKEFNIKIITLPKPFLLLAGISGTGKTRFVREQAKSTGSLESTYCLTSVRPDWHEPSDLLGYVSRLGNNPQYVATDLLRFIVKAWREIIDGIKKDENGLPLDWRGRELADIRPFWLCLDEMNLAPVEQYFADYLSVLETRCWNDPDKLQESGLSYVYECDPLIKGEVFTSLDADTSGMVSGESDKPSTQLAKDLGFDLNNDTDKDIWNYFLAHGISIPFNLIVAGTVNMDETTHGFSRKVIDRALSFDFGEFFPNNIDEFFSARSEPKKLSFPLNSHAKLEQFRSITADPDAVKTKAFFKTINAVLLGTPFELAFRAFNELCLSVISFSPETGEELDAVFDDFLMCKVLPRIEGDEDKLITRNNKTLLQHLTETLTKELKSIWNSKRIDLMRENKSADEKVIRVQCRSKLKLEYMQSKLESGFTSFWP